MDEHLIPPNRPLLVSATLLMAALAGCEGSGSKVKDPVVPPPPRRISMDDTPDPRRSKRDDSDETAVASADGWKQMGKSKDVKLSGGAAGNDDEVAVASVGTPLAKGEVAAIVNGRPIFYDDVAVRATPQLKQAKAQLSPVEYRKFRRMVVEKYLEPYIERELLLQALRRKLKPEQFDSLQKGLNKQVDEDLKQEMERLGVSSIGELEVELRKSDLSVEAMRTMIRNQKMAEQFLASRAVPRDGFDRPDLVAFYKENLDKYRIEARVRWQQIQLTYSKNGGAKKTEELAKQLIAQLKSLLRVRHLHSRLASRAVESQYLNQRLQQAFEQIDGDTELTRRIHRGFLPKTMPEVGQARFAVCYRPRSRIGGDFYDVMRLDEDH
ncbi:MAG: hypothetical protein NT069_01995, partial [Planctomycetota bacterium]|nr:hypothetical protein [Planctomycetota bacterium]